MSYAADVRAFHDAIGQPNRRALTEPPVSEVELRLRLLAEEFGELVEAMLGYMPADLKAALDGLADLSWWEQDDGRPGLDFAAVAKEGADLVVVTLGLFPHYGIDFDAVWRVVHASNIAKAPTCDECGGRGLIPDPDRGSGWGPYWDDPCARCHGRGREQPSTRVDGKALKPDGWQPPDVKGALGL